jgi:16S rRNA (uracil1498-N3)-methyltransferase
VREGFAAADAARAHVFVAVLADAVEVSDEDGHHLAAARRLRAGERVTAADGSGRWRPYVVQAVDRRGLSLGAAGPAVEEPGLVPALAVAPALRKGGLDAVVARCTELGVDAVVPLRAARAVVGWDDERTERALARLRRVARESAMQCRRARLPAIHPPATVEELAGRPGCVVADRAGVMAGALEPPPASGWTLLCGPEGGFAPDETARLAHLPRVAVGPHVLRAETAAIAAAAALTGLRVPRRAREA